MGKLYRVAEFARLAGVTVRTLQYYDRIGLLRPSQTSAGGYRLYQRRDLLRLQQIVTLKWMGFKLEQIRQLLDSPHYDLWRALRLQQAAIDRQIASLQAASAALERVLESEALRASLLDGEGLQAVIQAVTSGPDEQQLRELYSAEAWAAITMRRMQHSPEELVRFTQDWQALIDHFDELRHYPPDSQPIQQLAATMARYIEHFTAGDEDTAQGLARVWSSPDVLPQAYRLADAELERLMRDALAIYYQKRNS